MSRLRKYIPDPHVIQVDDVKVRENLTVEASPLRVEDRKVKHLRGKKIAQFRKQNEKHCKLMKNWKRKEKRWQIHHDKKWGIIV